MEHFGKHIQTVSELTLSIKGLLENGFAFVTVIGEISNLKVPPSGHHYFTLKDHNAQLKAVMFKTQQRYLNIRAENGIEVICRGRISVYDARGEYQLLVDSMDLKGAGLFQITFERLKSRLADEGLFAAAHKKPLPLLPTQISLITAPNGAAVFDFLNVAEARFPGIPIEIFPVRVQGAGSADDIVNALQLLNLRSSSDVIVLCRGGGSIEDLRSFNEEAVARAIYASEIPVVSAIGHEIDFTIADFVADVRAPTPTAAAQCVVPDRAVLQNAVSDSKQRLVRGLDKKLAAAGYRLQIYRQKLGDPSSSLAHHLLRLDHTITTMLHAATNRLHRDRLSLEVEKSRLFLHDPRLRLANRLQKTRSLHQKLIILGKQHIAGKISRFQQAAALLNAVNPLTILARGFSITRSTVTGQIIHDSRKVSPGETIDVRLQHGVLFCEITGKKDDENLTDRIKTVPE
ncbi:MAG: exodeoxyribonuclease VII large subunit [Deltaproteobacteria bacterium RIFOXYD12_FULL_50_9]|nr:MAG: exodeoxyribonuclease VII large subunit [Deltaproteobacteria bacterium RIFOXYD12_FULL_50_9]